MLEAQKITDIVTEVAAAKLSSANFERAESEEATDSEGHDALRIMIVLKPGVAERLNGDTVLDTLVQIQRRLAAAGEDRLPIVEYATEEELAGGDPQS
jgi:hypothetical protein